MPASCTSASRSDLSVPASLGGVSITSAGVGGACESASSSSCCCSSLNVALLLGLPRCEPPDRLSSTSSCCCCSTSWRSMPPAASLAPCFCGVPATMPRSTCEGDDSVRRGLLVEPLARVLASRSPPSVPPPPHARNRPRGGGGAHPAKVHHARHQHHRQQRQHPPPQLRGLARRAHVETRQGRHRRALQAVHRRPPRRQGPRHKPIGGLASPPPRHRGGRAALHLAATHPPAVFKRLARRLGLGAAGARAAPQGAWVGCVERGGESRWASGPRALPRTQMEAGSCTFPFTAWAPHHHCSARWRAGGGECTRRAQ